MWIGRTYRVTFEGLRAVALARALSVLAEMPSACEPIITPEPVATGSSSLRIVFNGLDAYQVPPEVVSYSEVKSDEETTTILVVVKNTPALREKMLRAVLIRAGVPVPEGE